MPMRMSGLMSGMDTETIIGQLVEARSVKVNNAKKAQTKLGWSQDAWKDLNKKLKNLQSKFVSNMRFVSSYSKKTTKVSNSSVVSVITGENAVNGVQALEVNKMAKTGYMTGAELKAKDAEGHDTDVKGNYTAMTKLSELGVSAAGSFTVRSKGKDIDVAVDGETTISDVLSKLKEAGLNASFDTKSQRFFVSAKESGAANDFSITASNDAGAAALSALGLQTAVSEEADLATWNRYKSFVMEQEDQGEGKYRAKTLDEMGTEIANALTARKNAYLDQYSKLQDDLKAAEARNADIDSQLANFDGKIAALEAQLEDDTLSEDDIAAKTQELEILNADRATLAGQKVDTQAINDKIAGVEDYITVEKDDDGNITNVDTTDYLKDKVNEEFAQKAAYAAKALNKPADVKAGATKVSGVDAEITLNGAKFTNSTNVFEINGLTFTALSETKPGESVTVTTQQDTDGIYDMVKSFLKEYNSIINEMDKLYNAESARGYEPLTDDEKEALSDSEVEKYETKIKDALLRKDSNLSNISNTLKKAMSAGIEVGGKTMRLFDFGIDMLSYFAAADNEKNAYHIDGDPDDNDTSGKADKLKSMISSNPDTVISFFTQLSKNLYSEMDRLSKSVDGYRSFGSFYDDKKMKTDYDDYKTKIADLEDKLNKYEDSWYKRFSKMETAMAKMQQNATALSGLLGGGS